MFIIGFLFGLACGLMAMCIVVMYYMDRINNYLEWMKSRPSEKVKYNELKFVKKFILKYKLTDEFIRDYCYDLEHNNPREEWNKQLRK